MLSKKVKKSEEIIRKVVDEYDQIAVASSFGKDSMAVVHLARRVDPDIPIFSVMTPFKPEDTFSYLVRMDNEMKLDVTVYMVAKEAPRFLRDNGLEVKLLASDNFEKRCREVMREYDKPIYEVFPDECCRLLKVEPMREAVKDLDAWITGLRRSEGSTRTDVKEIEYRGLTKVNPILSWGEDDVWQYLHANNIEPHPWYLKRFPDGKRIRSLGCEPCTIPVYDSQPERAGRWPLCGEKKGGECGIHSCNLK